MFGLRGAGGEGRGEGGVVDVNEVAVSAGITVETSDSSVSQQWDSKSDS